MSRRTTRHIQPKVKGGREQVSPRVLREVRERADAIAARYNVSRSWVMSVVMADAFGVKLPLHLNYRHAGPSLANHLRMVRGGKR